MGKSLQGLVKIEGKGKSDGTEADIGNHRKNSKM